MRMDTTGGQDGLVVSGMARSLMSRVMRLAASSRRWAVPAIGVLALQGPLTHANAQAAPDPTPRPQLVVNASNVTTTRVQYRGRHAPAITSVFTGNQPSGFTITPPGVGNRDCAAVTASVAANFNTIDVGSELTLQLGQRQNEGFGSSYTLPSGAFPVEINLIEAFFGTIATGAGSITCGYEIRVYDGTPTNGTLVFSTVSDPDPSSSGLPGDISIQRAPGTCSNSGGTTPPAASVGKLQFSVDQTADPADRMILNNISGTGTFTVVVITNRMNQPNTNPCAIFGGEEPRCQNIFQATEANNTNALNFSTRNWLLAISCPSNPFAAPGGFYSFSQLGAVSPTTDVLQQVTYTPTFCTVIAGACCNAATGQCTLVNAGTCSGNYQGDNTTCTPVNPCPQPGGACCLASGACEIRTAALCTGSGTIFRGANTVCASANCPEPVGACCNGNGCAGSITVSTCTSLGGQFIGAGSTCTAGGACPLGACCLGSGACAANVSSPACTTQGGTFQGVSTACGAVSCPQPAGACCTTTGSCASVTATTCSTFGGTWQGAFTSCAPSPCSAPLGICCRGSICQVSVASSGCTGANTSFVNSAATSCGTSAVTPCCRADFNKIGGIGVQDIFDFLSAWFQASPTANLTGNGAGAPGVQSIFDFLAAWFAGGC